MDINLSQLKTACQKLTCSKDGWDAVYDIGKQLAESWSDSAPYLTYIAPIFDGISALELEQALNDAPEPPVGTFGLTANGKAMLIHFSKRVDEGRTYWSFRIVSCMSQACNVLLAEGLEVWSSQWASVTYVNDPETIAEDLSVTISELKTLISDVAIGQGITYALSSICLQLSSSVRAKKESVSDFIHSVIGQFTVIPPDWIPQLLLAAQQGGQSFASTIRDLLNRSQEQAAPETYVSSLTDVNFRTFSAGLVTQVAASIFSAAALALAGLSRLASAVVAVIGGILSVVGRVIEAASTAVGGTNYKVRSGEIHMFTFVLTRTSTSYASLDYAVSVLLTPYGLPPGTRQWISQGPGWVTLNNLVPDADGVGATVYSEVHLSCDYNLLHDQIIIKYVAKLESAYSFAISYKSLPGCYFGDYGNGTPWCEVSTSFKLASSNCYVPIDLSNFPNVWRDGYAEFNFECATRLLTALILWSGAFLVGRIGNYDGTPISIINPFYLTVDSSGAVNETFITNIFAKAGHLLWRAGGPTYYRASETYADFNTPVFTTAWNDEVLSFIQSIANGLPMEQLVTSTEFKYWEHDESIFRELTLSNLAPDNLGSTHGVRFFDPASTPDAYLDATFTLVDHPSRMGVSGQGTIDLPDSLFSAYVWGLFVDALILVAAVAAVVASAVVAAKIGWKVTQLQAKTEAAWYTYQDDPSSANWLEYKRARVRYNVSATLTGRTTLGKGLYDDSGDSDLLELPQSASYFSEIKRIITGS